MTAPKVAASPQDIAILNLNMLMQLEGRYRKDLAEYIGRRPQNLSRMMSGESNWALNDMWKAAEFVGVSLDVLTDPTLTPAKRSASSASAVTITMGMEVCLSSTLRLPPTWRGMEGPGYGSGRLIFGPVGIITQRSMVQIHAPLPIETGNLLVSGFFVFLGRFAPFI